MSDTPFIGRPPAPLRPRNVKGGWTDADRVRHLISEAGLTQRAAARELEINERTMRNYCAGKTVPPKAVLMALAVLAGQTR